MLRILALVAAMAIAAPVVAQETIPNGMVDGGYTFNNGHWWSGGRAFTRFAQKVCSPHGCSYRWCYKQVNVPVAPAVTVVNNLIGVPVPIAYQQPIAAQGSSVYSVAPAQLVQPVDYLKVLQQAERLAQQSQALTSDATSGFLSLAQETNAGQQRVAEIIASGQAAAAALTATKPQAIQQIRSQSLTFKLSQGMDGAWKVDPHSAQAVTSAKDPVAFRSALTEGGCITCHSGQNAKGKLNLADLASLTTDQAASIVERATTADTSKRMPPADSGKVLSPAALRVILNTLVE